MQKLPIGIQTFLEIRNENYIYIDKTQEAYSLITKYKYVFLSRPRRFGKSLFLDTLKEIFEGNKALFKGLYIYDKYDFDDFPVIRIDFTGGDFLNPQGLKLRIGRILPDIVKSYQLDLDLDCPDDVNNFLEQIIKELWKKTGKKVVVLIDEYDKPILDAISKPELAHQNREFLKVFYSVLKANDQYIRFGFLTGVSKFSKVSIFSGLNNIEDISLNHRYGNICGYTQQNIENEFSKYLQGVDLEKLKEWYNGYNFLKDKVYNPFDILLFIRNSTT